MANIYSIKTRLLKINFASSRTRKNKFVGFYMISKGTPKIKDTKLNAALQLYHQKELTINEICKAIGISRGTLYKYLK